MYHSRGALQGCEIIAKSRHLNYGFKGHEKGPLGMVCVTIHSVWSLLFGIIAMVYKPVSAHDIMLYQVSRTLSVDLPL